MSDARNSGRDLFGDTEDLIKDVFADDYWGPFLTRMRDLLLMFDPGIVEELDDPTIGFRKKRSIVRYCIPLFEMYRALDDVEPDPSWLAAMYLWQEAWRPLDNLLDQDGPFSDNFRSYNIAILRAMTFHLSIFSGANPMAEFLSCLYDTLDIEDRKKERVDASLIFKRARLYEVVFGSLPEISIETRNNFRFYINTVTIAHDFGDILNDISEGNATFATNLLESIDPNRLLIPKNYKALQVSSEEAFRMQQARLNIDALKSCWVAQRNLNSFFNWAFRT